MHRSLTPPTIMRTFLLQEVDIGRTVLKFSKVDGTEEAEMGEYIRFHSIGAI